MDSAPRTLPEPLRVRLRDLYQALTASSAYTSYQLAIVVAREALELPPQSQFDLNTGAILLPPQES